MALAAIRANFGLFLSRGILSVFHGEFDSGSERTLAAWIRHASRTGYCCSNTMMFSGARVRNTWGICREVGDSSSKGELIPHVVRKVSFRHQSRGNLALLDDPAAYQLVGEVT